MREILFCRSDVKAVVDPEAASKLEITELLLKHGEKVESMWRILSGICDPTAALVPLLERAYYACRGESIQK